MLPRHEYYIVELKKMIEREIEQRKENLVTGHSVFDFPTYQFNAGFILGLRDALELCDEAEKEVNQKLG
jgi:mannose/fructose/N-acetylgalactosamine-specific phosphotransferase system component IID